MKIFINILFIIFFLFTSNIAFAVNKNFNVTSGNWNVAGNWSPSGVPASSDEVIIPAGRTCTITANVAHATGGANAVITVRGTLIINASVTLTEDSGLYAENGGVINNNGTILMTTNADQGLWAMEGGVINNAGTITINNPSYCQLEGTINNTGTFTNNGFIGSLYAATNSFNSSRYTNPPFGTVGVPANVDCLHFTAGLTNNGTIDFDVNSGNSCAQYDAFEVTGGSMIFGGFFSAADFTGNAQVNTDLVVMTYPSRTGTFTNSYVDLGNGKYANVSYGATELTLKIRSTIILPVELVSFDAKITKTGKTHLTWATASEHNNEGFEIEKSTDGTRFEKIGFVAGAGNSNQKKEYAFEDASAFERSVQVVYYRLRQVDHDGAYEYSNIVSVKNTLGNTNIKIYPTTTTGLLTVEAQGASVDVVTVVNQVGQVVLTAQKVNSVDMSALPAGLYLVQVQAAQEQLTERVFKQ